MNSTVVFLALHFVQILTYYGCFVLSLNLRFRKKYPLILGIGVTIALSILKCSDIIAEHDAAVFLIQANQLILLINVIILFKDSLKLKLFYFVLMITASAAAEYLTRAAAVLRGDKIVWDFTVWYRPELIPYHYMMCFFFIKSWYERKLIQDSFLTSDNGQIIRSFFVFHSCFHIISF